MSPRTVEHISSHAFILARAGGQVALFEESWAHLLPFGGRYYVELRFHQAKPEYR